MQNKVRTSLLLSLLFFSPVLYAIGLGDATVRSYLNQPLDVRIDLISQNPQELTTVGAAMASANDFALVGLSRSALSMPLEFDVVQGEDGASILVSSQLAMDDPVVQILLEVTWSGGRMLRQYTLFLDPPTIAAPAPPPRATPPAREQTRPEPELQPESAAEPRPATPSPRQEPDSPVAPAAQDRAAPVSETSLDDSSEYGPVRSGDTLWSIARKRASGSGHTINQVMLAIQRDNPEAFIRGNINSLKRGAILRLPSQTRLGEMTASEALLEVARQEDEYLSRPRRPDPLAEPATIAVAAQAAAEPEAQDQGRAGTGADADSGAGAEEDLTPETSPVAEQAEPLQPQPAEESAQYEERAGRLELVPPSEEDLLAETTDPAAGDDAASNPTTQGELALAEEELLSAQQENAYLSERIRELERELEQARSATVVDPELAQVESNLRDQRQARQQASQQEPAASPWYSGWWPWLLGLLVLIVIASWLFRRVMRGGAGSSDESIQQIREEAEEVLEVLDSSEAETRLQPAETDEPPPEAEAEVEGEVEDGETVIMASDEDPGDDATVVQTAPPPKPKISEGDAEELDLEDPEIKLDLARAYLSMGDREASRAMLEEVLESGTDAQKVEARAMMKEL